MDMIITQKRNNELPLSLSFTIRNGKSIKKLTIRISNQKNFKNYLADHYGVIKQKWKPLSLQVTVLEDLLILYCMIFYVAKDIHLKVSLLEPLSDS